VRLSHGELDLQIAATRCNNASGVRGEAKDFAGQPIRPFLRVRSGGNVRTPTHTGANDVASFLIRDD
jgi:hypothetical protein